MGELASPTGIVRRAVRVFFIPVEYGKKYALRSSSVRFALLTQRLRHSFHNKAHSSAENKNPSCGHTT